MKVTVLSSVYLLSTFCHGRKFSLPVHQTMNELQRFPSSYEQYDQRGQKVLNRPASGSHRGSKQNFYPEFLSRYGTLSSPVQFQYPWVYTTNISLGTPPQSFRAVIDLSWTDLFVPSFDCGGSHASEKEKFNATASSTFLNNGTRSELTYSLVFAYGILASDTFHLGEVEVRDQMFHNLKYYEMVFPDAGVELFDSAFGLAVEKPFWDNPIAPSILPSPFRSMIDQGILDEDIFSIRFPQNETDEGEITFGGMNGEFEGDLVFHPLFPEYTTNWQIRINGISVAGDEYYDQPLSQSGGPETGYTAILSSSSPDLVLPKTLATPLLNKIPHTISECTKMAIVPCASVPSLPGLTVHLEGQNITLSGVDYVLRWTPDDGFCPDAEEECMVMIEGYEGSVEIPENMVFLGTPFLRKVVGVFDWDGKRVGFGKLKN